MSQTEIVTIERMLYGSDAIAHLSSGKVVFVADAVTGDVAEIALFQEKAAFARAKAVTIVEPSPYRRALASPADATSGTAPWQCLAYDMQLKQKRDCVVDALVRIGHMDEEAVQSIVQECRASKYEWEYRNKVELTAGQDAQGRFDVGFHEEETGTFVSVDHTLLAHKNMQQMPKALRGALRYLQRSQDLGIHRIGVRHSRNTGDLEVALWTRPDKFPRAVAAKTIASAIKATSIVRVIADAGKARNVKRVEVLHGRGFWREKIGDVRYSTSAPSFFQVNTDQANTLVQLVLSGLGHLENAFVVDLYAGGGTFSIPIAKAGACVTAVESARSSVRDLRYNTEANDVSVHVRGGDAAREIAHLGKIDALVVDPPRSGLASDVPQLIAEAQPARLVYVSCNPQTLARDLARLQQLGFRVDMITPVDMFPQTYHVEVVVSMSRTGSRQ